MAELPRRKVSHILHKTLLSLGYDKAMADNAIWSTLWLQDRGHTDKGSSGISLLIVYMLLMHGTPFEQLKPRKHKELVLIGKCPFMLAERIILMENVWRQRGKIGFGAPVFPFLMIPLLVEHFARKNLDVRIKYKNKDCVGNAAGVQMDWETSKTFIWANTSNDDFMMVELIKRTEKSRILKVPKLSKLNLPDARLQGSGPLKLGDIN